MKFVKALLVAVMTIAVFFSIFEIFSEREMSDAHNLYGLNNTNHKRTIEFQNNIIELKPEEYVSKLIDLAKKNNVYLVVYQKETEKNNVTLNYYIYPNEEISVIKELPSRSFNNKFNLSNPVYSTNKDLYPRFLLGNTDDRLNVNIYDFNSIVYNPSMMYYGLSFYSLNQQDIESFAQDALEEFQFSKPEVFDYNNHTLDYDSAYKGKLLTLLLISTALYLLYAIFYISENLKKISIQKLHGYSNVSVVFSIIKPIILSLLIYQIVVSVTLIAIKVGFSNPSIKLFFKEYFKALMTVNLIMVIVFGVVFILVKYLSLPKLIKNFNANNALLNLSFFTKIVFVILLVPLITPGLNIFINQVRSYSHVFSQKKQVENVVKIESVKIEDRFDGYDVTKYVEGNLDEYYYEAVKKFDDLNDTNRMIFFKSSLLDLKASPKKVGSNLKINPVVNLYKVNGKYVELNNVVNNRGELLNIDTSGEIVYFLIPESIIANYSIQENYLYTYGNPYEIINIKDNQELPDYFLYKSFEKVDEGKGIDKNVYAVYSDNSFRYDKSIDSSIYLINVETIDQAEELLKTVDDKKTYNLTKVEDKLVDGLKNIWLDIVDALISMAIPLLTLVLLSITIVVLYYRTKLKKLSIYKTLGYSTIRANFDLIIEILLSLSVPAVILIRLVGVAIIPSLILVLVTELACLAWIFIKYRNLQPREII